MNYELIEILRNRKKIPKMEFYSKVGMTHKGFNQMVENNSIKVSTLNKIADVLGVPVGSFFESHTTVGGDIGQDNFLEAPEPFGDETVEQFRQRYPNIPDRELINLALHEKGLLKLELDITKALLDKLQKQVDSLTAKKPSG